MSTVLTVVEAAERLRISRQMVQRLAITGELTHIRIGRRILIREEDLEAFLDASQVGARKIKA